MIAGIGITGVLAALRGGPNAVSDRLHRVEHGENGSPEGCDPTWVLRRELQRYRVHSPVIRPVERKHAFYRQSSTPAEKFPSARWARIGRKLSFSSDIARSISQGKRVCDGARRARTCRPPDCEAGDSFEARIGVDCGIRCARMCGGYAPPLRAPLSSARRSLKEWRAEEPL